MRMIDHMKRIIAIATMVLLVTGLLSGCSETPYDAGMSQETVMMDGGQIMDIFRNLGWF